VEFVYLYTTPSREFSVQKLKRGLGGMGGQYETHFSRKFEKKYLEYRKSELTVQHSI